MNNTSRNRNLIFIIAGLLFTNITVLVYFLWLKEPGIKPPSPGERNRNGMTGLLQKEVGFNDTQLAQYKQLKDKQWETLRPIFDEMRKAKESLFRLLALPGVNDSVINKTADIIAEKQKALDLKAFDHFRQVRGICTPDQQSKYDSVISGMFRRMGRPEHHNEKKKEEKTR